MGSVAYVWFFAVDAFVRVSVVTRGSRFIGSRLVLATQRPAVRALPSCWFICYIMSIIYAPVHLGHSCWHVARSR